MPPQETLVETGTADYILPHSCPRCRNILLPVDLDTLDEDELSTAARSSELLERIKAFINIPVESEDYSESIELRLLNVEPRRMKCFIAEGCRFYELISDGLKRLRDKERLRNKHGASSTIFPPIVMSSEESQNHVIILVRSLQGARGEFIELLWVHSTRFGPNIPRIHDCSLWMNKDYDPYSDRVETPASNANRPVNIFLDGARKWLEDCSQHHKSCSSDHQDFVPTRLIKIYRTGGKQLIHLQESVDPGVRYTALSYCWGGDQAVRTTKATLTSHKTSIKLHDLTPTIRDAVIVTEKLGVQYLWVDALCIVQDDEEDRSREIGQMGRVYENATLTILASGAMGAWEGFLHNFLPAHYDRPDWVFEVNHRPIYYRDVQPVILHPQFQAAEDCLSQRGWAFQENLFSKRTLKFDSTCMHWSCQMTYDQYCERQLYKCGSYFEKAEHTLYGRYVDSDATTNDWYKLVATFSTKSIILARDRLPAIGGIAKHFGSMLDSEYLAGIWQSTLPIGLLWNANAGKIKSYQPRSLDYLAPSWSWASCLEAIHYDPSITWRKWDPREYQAEILEINVVPQVEGGTYGEIGHGSLVLRGFVIQAHWTLPETPDILDTGTIDTIPPSLPVIEINRDGMEIELLDTFKTPMSVCLLVLLHADGYNKCGIVGLILRESLDNNYSRLGMFKMRPAQNDGYVAFPRSATIQNITIV